MHIIIDNYDVNVSVQNNRFCLQKADVKKFIVPTKVSAIHILTPCQLTTAVITLAAENNIAILLYNNKGKVIARLWQPHFGSHAAIRLRQVQFCTSANGLIWVKQLILAKIKAQLRSLLLLPAQLQNSAINNRLNTYINMLAADAGINHIWLRSAEAAAGRWYWAGVTQALKQHVAILPRNLRPAKDKFNALLNYLYGTLYGITEGCILAAGLDAHLGILHRIEYNTPSLVFDIIEPFRHWADDFLIQQVLTNNLPDDYTEIKAGGVLLTSKGKKNILSLWFAYLQQKIPAPKKLIKRKDQVQQLCTTLAAQLLKEYKEQNKDFII